MTWVAPSAGDLVACETRDGASHIRRIVTKPLNLNAHPYPQPSVLCGVGVAMRDLETPAAKVGCETCRAMLARVPH